MRAEVPAIHMLLAALVSHVVEENLVYLNHQIVLGEVCHFGSRARLHSVVFMLRLNSVKLYNYAFYRW